MTEKLKNQIERQYIPIEPESILNKKLKSTIRRLTFYGLGLVLFMTPFSTVITMGEVQRGKTKQSYEEEFRKDIPYAPYLFERLNDYVSKPGRELGYYLYEKGWRL